LSGDPAGPGRLFRRVAAALRDRRGVSAIEFGVIVPVIVVIVLGTYDIGNLVRVRMKLAEAAFAGGQYAVAFPMDTDGIARTVKAALPAGWTGVRITGPTTACACWSGGAEGAALCTDEPVCPTGQVQRTVTLGLTMPYSPLLVMSLTSISASYAARIQ
jgi:Flp pilus assembly protein TadG